MFTSSRTQQATHTNNRTGVVVDGVDAIVRDFTSEAQAVPSRAAATVLDHARQAADRMRSTVPVDQGDVLDSITVDPSATIAGQVVYADAGPDQAENAGAFVARFLENGTVKMAPRPFVGPAADEQLPKFERAIRDLPRL